MAVNLPRLAPVVLRGLSTRISFLRLNTERPPHNLHRIVSTSSSACLARFRASSVELSAYGQLIGYPELKPHDLRHGVAVEVLEQRHDLEEVRALLGHARIDTTQIYTKIRPPQLKRAVATLELVPPSV